MAEIAPIDNRPWIPRPIPSWLAKELTRRKNDFGISYLDNSVKSEWDVDGNWNSYRGPLSPWIRICSNGNGRNKFLDYSKSSPDKKGFVFYGGQGFKDSFGINDNKTILGYEVTGNPHVIPTQGTGFNYNVKYDGSTKNVQPFLPAPGIVSVEANVQKELIRSVTIKWNCYGFSQLEYMTPYFLTPGITLIAEIGWNHFNPKSLLDLTDIDTLGKLWRDGTLLYENNMANSRGMYDVTFGIINNFEFSSQDGVKWDCSTTIGSKHRNFSGIPLNNSNTENDPDGRGGSVRSGRTTQTMTFPQFVEKRLKKIKECLTQRKNFFDQLDSTEKDLFVNPTKKFYNGHAENRMFFGRDKNVDNTSSPTILNPPYIGKFEDSDWDYKDTDKSWVSMGFLIELFNYFFTKPSNNMDSSGESFQFYKINPNSKTIIGAHPNLISCNGDVCLIPNANAPKYNNWLSDILLPEKSNKYSSQTLEVKNDGLFLSSFRPSKMFLDSATFSVITSSNVAESGQNYADAVILNSFNTGNSRGLGVARDNLDGIINRFRYSVYNLGSGIINNKTPFPTLDKKGSHSFPQYDSADILTKKPAGYYGYLEDIMINTDFIINTVKQCKTTGEFYTKLLESLNDSVNGFWDLKVVEGADYLSIIDQKLFSLDELQKVKVYQFDMGSANNIIKNIAFSSTMSDIQANQVIAASSNNQGRGTTSTSQPLDFVFGDRLFLEPPTDVTPTFISNKQAVRQLQTSGDKPDAFIMSFRNVDTHQLNVVNLTLPDKSLLTSILNDNDVTNNTNVYGGQQPNFTLEFSLQGIAGFRTFQCLSFKNFPKPYSDKDVIFQIVDVSHTVSDNNWDTRIKAAIRPLRNYKNFKIQYTDGSDLL